MYPLTEILSPTLPQTDLIAAAPNLTRAEFNRAVFALSGRLKTAFQASWNRFSDGLIVLRQPAGNVKIAHSNQAVSS